MGMFKSETEKKFVIIVGSIIAIFVIVEVSKIIGKVDSCECVDVWVEVESIGNTDPKVIEQYEQCLRDWGDYKFAEKDCFNL
jgi:hypothetical protein